MKVSKRVDFKPKCKHIINRTQQMAKVGRKQFPQACVYKCEFLKEHRILPV
jgi:hypothetical protein